MKKEWNLKKTDEFDIYYMDFPNEENDGLNKNNRITNNANSNIDEEKQRKKSGKKLQIISEDIRKRKRIISILLAKNNQIIGASEIHIMEDNNAELSSSTFWDKSMIELPENLKENGKQFDLRRDAIIIFDQYRGKGYGTDLLKIILAYLETLHVEKLEVHGIVQRNGAINFYKNTGACIIDDTEAEYNVTEALKFLKTKKRDTKEKIEGVEL